jgi:transcriptional regulator with XRE-family HTH domain
MKTTGADELLERLRSQRSLPPATERRRIREAAGASLRDVAAVLGVTPMAVHGWEKGKTPREARQAYARLLEELKQIAV